VVDCDPQGNATTGLGVDKHALADGLYACLMGQEGEEGAVLETGLDGLYLVGADRSLIGAEVEMAALEGREYYLKQALSPLKDGFDFLFLDCPPSLGFLTINALTAADGVIVPLQCEYYALEGLSQLLETVQAVKRGLNPSLELVGIVLTMYDARNNLSVQVEEEVRSHFGDQVFQAVIPRNVRLSEAPSHGQPILLYDIKSKGAQSYLELAKEWIQRRNGRHV
jgi:chromosome partitioning protein